MSNPPQSQYTGSFLNLLEGLKSSLIISTYQAKKLVVLRSVDGDLNTHFTDINKPMGIAFKGKRLSVGSGNRIIDYINNESAASNIGLERGYDAAFLPRRVHVTGDIDVHEIQFDEQDRLWFINTRLSCLCTLDVNFSFVPQWKPPFITEYEGTDRCHLNGLAMRDGKPRYVTALGSSNVPTGWRENKATGGVLIDILSNQIILEGLSMPHSPRWYRNRLWVLESGSGQLITVCPDKGTKTIITELPGFCRGIDFIDKYAFIGLSEVRETALFAGLPLTAREQDRKCGIWVVDIETGSSVAFLEFTSGVHEIFAVQCLPMQNPAILDFDHKLLDTSYTVPRDALAQFATPNPMQLKIDQSAQWMRSKNYSDAITSMTEVVDEDPTNNHARHQLAIALSANGQWQEASMQLKDVIANDASNAEALNLLGEYHLYSGSNSEALNCFDSAIAIDRQFALALVNRGIIELLQGNFTTGWPALNWQQRLPDKRKIDLPHEPWQGDKIDTKALLVLAENYGEAIMFARFLSEARQRCSKLIVVCDSPLLSLFDAMECVDEVKLHGKLLIDSFDTYAPITSMPSLLGLSSNDESRWAPYLGLLPKSVQNNSKSTTSSYKNLGIIYPPAFSEKLDHRLADTFATIIRAIDLDSPLQQQLNTTLVSQDTKMSVGSKRRDEHFSEADFHAVAAVLAQMDIVFSACPAIINLAGAMGITTIALCNFKADWWWLGSNKENRWYPSVKVVRLPDSCEDANAIELSLQLIRNFVNAEPTTERP